MKNLEKEMKKLEELVRKYNDISNDEIIKQQDLLIREYGMFVEDVTVAAIIDKIKLRENPEYRKAIAKRVSDFFEDEDED